MPRKEPEPDHSKSSLTFAIETFDDPETGEPTQYGRFIRNWQDEEALDVLIEQLEAGRVTHKQALIGLGTQARYCSTHPADQGEQARFASRAPGRSGWPLAAVWNTSAGHQMRMMLPITQAGFDHGIRLDVPVFHLVITARNRVRLGICRLDGKKPMDKRVDGLAGQVRHIERDMQSDSESVVMMQRPAFVDFDLPFICDARDWTLNPIPP